MEAGGSVKKRSLPTRSVAESANNVNINKDLIVRHSTSE